MWRDVAAGSLVDVEKLMAQLERSEKARLDTEKRLQDTTKALNDLKESSEKHTSIRDKLQVSLKTAFNVVLWVNTIFVLVDWSERVKKEAAISRRWS